MAICALSYYMLLSLSLLIIRDTEVLIQMHLHAMTECKPHFVKIGIMWLHRTCASAYTTLISYATVI